MYEDEKTSLSCFKSNDDNKEELLLSIIQWAKENRISEYDFPRDIEKLKRLKTLKLGNDSTSIKNLPEAIGCLTNLTEIFIGGNVAYLTSDASITRKRL